MSKERDLLKRLVSVDLSDIYDLLIEAQELLAQPEQEPVAWMNDSGGCFLSDGNKYSENWISLYTSPPKRESIEDGELEVWYSQHTWAMDKQEYIWGFRDAEKCYGIGV